MLAFRRLPRCRTAFAGVRGNATSQVASTSSELAPPPPPSAEVAKPAPAPKKAAAPVAPAAEQDAAKGGRTVERKWPTRRPRIDLQHPREWNRPIARGVLPVYDEALEYIKEDSANIKVELKELQARLEAAETLPEEQRDPDAIQEMRKKVRILDVQSEANLPDVRWKAWNAMGDLNKLVYRHLLEQRWREDGALDLLMERLHQMNVIPDLLPELHPSLDLRLNFPEVPKGWARNRVKRKYTKVEPGIFLLPEQTWRQPVLYTTVFHPETRLYTLLMVDLDVPDAEHQSFQTYLHWMQPNIALSASSPSPIPLSTTHTRYIPPHPQQGTPAHRYAVFLLPQSSAERISVPIPTDAERLGFDVRVFIEKYGLSTQSGGAHMWREEWDETVSRIFKDVLKTEEPRYGRPPKADPYVDIKQVPKYI